VRQINLFLVRNTNLQLALSISGSLCGCIFLEPKAKRSLSVTARSGAVESGPVKGSGRWLRGGEALPELVTMLLNKNASSLCHFLYEIRHFLYFV